jgi:hypothetical protein
MLEATARGEMPLTELTASLLAHCRGDADAVWEVLALVDQYFRRGRIGAEVSATIKSELHALVFHTRAPTQASASRPPTANLEQRPHSEPPTEDSELLHDIVRANKLIYECAPADAIAEPILQSAAAAENFSTRVSGNGGVSDKQSPPTAEVITAREGPQLQFREPSYEPGISTKAKLALGAALLVAVVVAVGYMRSTSNTDSSKSPLASNATKPTVEQPSSVQTPADEQAQLAADTPSDGAMHLPSAAEPLPAPELHAPVSKASNSVPTADAVLPAGVPKREVSEVQAAPVGPSASATAPAVASTGAATAVPIKQAAVQRVSFVDDPIVVDTGDSVARVIVRRSGSTGHELSLPWHTVEGSAKAERDYVPTAEGVLSFAVGTRDAAILVPIVQGSTRQHSDWFEVEITTGVSSGADEPAPPVRATVVITSTQAEKPDATTNPSGASDPP